MTTAPLDTWEVTAAGAATKNGVVVTGATSGVIALYYFNHFVYQINVTGNSFGTPGWSYWNGSTWIPSAAISLESTSGSIGVSNISGGSLSNSASITLNSITLSATTFPTGVSGATVGNIIVNTTPGGSFNLTTGSLSHTNTSQFSINSQTLQTAAALTAGTYSDTITATLANATPSSITATFSSLTTGSNGPVVTGSFINIDFATKTGATVYPQLFGVATGGIFNNSSYLNSTTFRSLVSNLNLPLFRLNATDWDSNTPTNLSPLATNITSLVPSTCTIIIGAQPSGTTSSTYATPGSGQILWNGVTYSIDSNENMLANGAFINGGSGTGAIDLFNNTLYAQDATSGTWFTFDGTNFTQTSAPGNLPGSGSSLQTAYKAVSDYCAANFAIPVTYFEVGNEISVEPSTIDNYQTNFYVAGAAGYHQTNANLKVGGPVWAGFDGSAAGAGPSKGAFATFIADNSASTLQFLTFHQYLYCQQNSNFPNVPSNSQVCQAYDPNVLGQNINTPSQSLATTIPAGQQFPVMMQQMEALTAGTYAANYPVFLGEFNIECSASFNDLRAGTSAGAAFMVSALLGFASGSRHNQAWGAIWDLMDDAGASYNLIDSSFNLYPQYYCLQQLIAHAPGTMVSATSQVAGVQAWATYNGTKVCVCIVNSTSSVQAGQIALSSWPVNSTGNATIHYWTYPTSANLGPPGTPVANTPGTTNTLTVTGGLAASINVPASSVAIIYSP